MIIGHYQGIPIGGRITEVRDDVVIVEIYPILPGPGDGGEPMPVAA